MSDEDGTVNDDLVTVAAFDKRGDADVCKVVLEQQGIKTFIADDNMVGGTSFFYGNALGYIKIRVASTDAASATELLQNFNEHWGLSNDQSNSDETAGTIQFVCEHCDKSIELAAATSGSIQSCPHCGEFIDVPDA